MPELANISASLYIISNWIIWSIMLCGLGLLLLRITNAHDLLSKPRALFFSFWSGYGILVFLLMLEHFFIALNYYAAILPYALSICGIILTRKWLFSHVASATNFCKRHPLCILLLIITIAAFAYYSRLGPVIFDTGKYHLQTVSWYAQAPVTYGLGNLCPYFAYNNANFLLAGLMEGTTLTKQSFHCFNTLLCLAFFLHIFQIVIKCWSNKKLPCLEDIFLLVYSLLMFAFIFGKSRSITPALSIDIACAYIMHTLIRLSCCYDKTRFRQLYILLLPLCALVFTVKLSYAVQTCLAVIIALIFCQRNLHSSKILKRYFILSVLFFAVFFTPWFARNIIMSGHFVFPMKITRLNLEWSVSEKVAQKVYADIKTWGRGFDCGDPKDNVNRTKFLNRPDAWKLPLFSMEWISVWFKLVWYNLYIWFAAILVFLASLIIYRKKIQVWSYSLLALPWFAGAAALFATAPTIRFLRASLFIFAAFSFAALINNFKPLNTLCRKLCPLLPVLLIILGIVYYKKGVQNSEYYRGQIINGFENAPAPRIIKDARQNVSGIPFNVISGSLWYAPLNSQAPAGLELLNPPALKSGFKIAPMP